MGRNAVDERVGRPHRDKRFSCLIKFTFSRVQQDAWLRPGNTASASNMQSFLDETLEILQQKKIGLLRADSGFYGDTYLQYFEARSVNYIVAVKLYPPLKWGIRSQTNWIEVDKGIQVAAFSYQAHGWKTSRRMIAVRQHIEQHPTAAGKKLFTETELGLGYHYSCFVTNLDLPAIEVWRMYRGRADAENRIKELKYDFAPDGFCLKKFWATEAAFRSIMMSYNLISLFRYITLQTASHHTLSTLKFKCYAIGSWIARHAGKKVLKLSISGQKRFWLDGLFSKMGNISPPFVFPNA